MNRFRRLAAAAIHAFDFIIEPSSQVLKINPGMVKSIHREKTIRQVNQDEMRGEGVDLRMFSTDPTADEPRKPSVWIHAELFSVAEKDEPIFQFQVSADVTDMTGESGQTMPALVVAHPAERGREMRQALRPATWPGDVAGEPAAV